MVELFSFTFSFLNNYFQGQLLYKQIHAQEFATF